MPLDDYHWLVSEVAAPWLELAREEIAQSRGATAALVTRLRKELSADRAHLVIEQAELRERAREKFLHAERMFFTRKGLEQATDGEVAAHKAARFPAGRIADLCCGIGGDAMALAQRLTRSASEEKLTRRASEGEKPTRRASEAQQLTRSVSEEICAVDLDPITAVLAAANLNACGCTGATVAAHDAAAFPVVDCAAWHIDPDRRPAGRRTSRVELFTPPLAAIERLLTQNASAAIKLAPAAQAPSAWGEVAELEWLGSRGECRQQVAWFGSLARYPGQRSATIVDAHGGPCTIVGQPAEPIPVAPQLGRYLFEPHAAVLAAKLEGTLCRNHALAALSPGIAYLTGDQLVDEPASDAFEVMDVLPLDQKRLKAYFRQRQIGRLEVKKRGVDIDPEKLRKSVIGEGEDAATLIISRVGETVQAIVAKRTAFSPAASASPAD
jgi:hypothetical protein